MHTSSEREMLCRNWHVSGAQHTPSAALFTGAIDVMRARPVTGRNLVSVTTALFLLLPPATCACRHTMLYDVPRQEFQVASQQHCGPHMRDNDRLL